MLMRLFTLLVQFFYFLWIYLGMRFFQESILLEHYIEWLCNLEEVISDRQKSPFFISYL